MKQVRTQAVARAKRARAHVVLLLPLIAAVVLAYVYRDPPRWPTAPELADEVVAALDRVSNGRHDG